MGRVVPRSARREDAPVLAELWSDVLRRADRADQVADLELVIKQAAVSPEQRFVVVEYDGEVAGAMFMRLTTISPINLEPCIQTIQPRVLPQFRHHGVGRALMEAATSFAEESGILYLNTAVPSTARDANRFMARLGLAPAAVYRIAPTGLVRSRLTPRSTPGAGSAKSLPRILAARRSQRRTRTETLGVTALGLPQDPVAPE